MNSCPVCRKRPAKRACPALAGSICPQCCARDRMLKLECPESCPHLQAGRNSSLERLGQERNRYLTERGLSLDTINENNVWFIVHVEGAIVNVQRGQFRSLTDQDVAEGMAKAIRTLETLDTGLYYVHHADSAAAQAVTDAIIGAVEQVDKEVPPEDRPRRAEVVNYLKYLSEAVGFHLRRGDGRDYLRHVTQFYPYPEKKSSLIVAP